MPNQLVFVEKINIQEFLTWDIDHMSSTTLGWWLSDTAEMRFRHEHNIPPCENTASVEVKDGEFVITIEFYLDKPVEGYDDSPCGS